MKAMISGWPPLATTEDRLLKVVGALREGEVDTLGVSTPERNGGVANALVQGVPEIVEDIGTGDSKLAGNALLEAQLDDLFRGLRIELLDNVISTRLDETRALQFKLDEADFNVLD
jgi:hypothetical protein